MHSAELAFGIGRGQRGQLQSLSDATDRLQNLDSKNLRSLGFKGLRVWGLGLKGLELRL